MRPKLKQMLLFLLYKGVTSFYRAFLNMTSFKNISSKVFNITYLNFLFEKNSSKAQDLKNSSLLITSGLYKRNHWLITMWLSLRKYCLLFQIWEHIDSEPYHRCFSSQPALPQPVLAEKSPRLLTHSQVSLPHFDLFIFLKDVKEANVEVWNRKHCAIKLKGNIWSAVSNYMPTEEGRQI